MLCTLCSNIDLDQLATKEGYKHHASCANLLQSAKHGCESCRLIWDTQSCETGGDLSDQKHDLGPLDKQIIARAVNQSPGNYNKIRYGQEKRSLNRQSKLMTKYSPSSNNHSSLEHPFLWSFLSIASEAGDLSSKYVKLRPLTQKGPEDWLPLASGWIKDCLANHETCASNSSTKVRPTRVIDVGPMDSTQDPRLHIAGEEVQEWVTLSHCWGTWGHNQPLRTITQTLAKHQQALPTNELPNLFQDAVKITRSLGFRYLWIDSLCIVQDSKVDWTEEISNMGSIYKNSVLTICADNCRDSTENILGNHIPIETKYVQQGCHSTKEGFKSVIHAFDEDEWQKSQHLLGYLRTRAWGLQEQILSPRTLQWAPLQTVWGCRCMLRSEECPAEGEDVITNSPFSQSTKLICLSTQRLEVARKELWKHEPGSTERDPIQIWYHMVREFCCRNLTFERDSLPAISGVANEVERHTGFEYRAGMWLQDMHNALLWTVEQRASYPSTYVAPSWSWASVEMGKGIRPACVGPTKMTFSGTDQPILTPLAEISAVDIVYDGGDDFGPVKSGSLRIKAPCRKVKNFEDRQVRLPLAEDKLPNYSEDPSSYKIQPSTMTCWLDARENEEFNEDEFSQVRLALCARGVVIAQLAFLDSSHVTKAATTHNYYQEKFKRYLQDQNWALVLEPIAGHEGEWKLIGIARIADDLKDGWQVQEFCII